MQTTTLEQTSLSPPPMLLTFLTLHSVGECFLIFPDFFSYQKPDTKMYTHMCTHVHACATLL